MVSLALVSISPVLPEIEQALAHGDSDRLLVKMLIPLTGGAMAVGAPLAGFLVDRIGVRIVLIVAALVFAIAGTMGFFLSNLYVLVGSRIATGIGAVGMATLSMVLINTRLDKLARARWMGFHVAIALLSSLVLYPAIGALGDLSWRYPFLLHSVGLAIAVSAALWLREAPATRGHRPRHGNDGSAGGHLLQWFPLWFLPLAFIIGSVTYLPAVYLSYVARDVGVTSASTISTLMLADSLIGAAMALAFGRSQRRISSNCAFLFSFLCTGLGLMLVAYAGHFQTVVVGMVVFGFGMGWLTPNLMTALSRRVDERQQGRSVGIVKAATFLASPLAVLLVEPIARAFGAAGALLTAAVMSLGVAMIFLVLILRA